MIKQLELPYYRQCNPNDQLSDYYANAKDLKLQGKTKAWLKISLANIEATEDKKLPIDFQAFLTLVKLLCKPTNQIMEYYTKIQ
jgi:hypothetical protein